MDKVILIICIVAVIVIICLIVKKAKSPIGKIYKTTDGFFANNPRNKKTRHCVVVEQRKKDGAIAVSKIFGADEKTGDFYIDNLTLRPKEHSSLTKESLVERRVLFGVKRNGAKKPIFRKQLTATHDRLTKKEMKLLNAQKGGKEPKNKVTYANTRKQWKQGFKKKNKRK